MPIYAFRCLNVECGLEFEGTLPIEKRNTFIMYCPECDEPSLRVPAPSTFRLHNGKVGGFMKNSGKVTGG
jgi:hypothetical protein